MAIYPTFIAPIFDKYTPLEEGTLRTMIEHLASKLHFPLTQIYVVDGTINSTITFLLGSKRSSHSNAYFYGFFKHKRIVVFDTILPNYKKSDVIDTKNNGDIQTEEKKEEVVDKTMTNKQILAVIAHELGHWNYSHTLKNFVIGQANFFFSFLVFSYLNNNAKLYEAFGFYGEKPVLIGLLLILNCFLKPYEIVVDFLQNIYSRKCENDADSFATDLGLGNELISGLLQLHKENLSFPTNDKLYAMWHFSHPSTVERIRAITHQMEKARSQGRYQSYKDESELSPSSSTTAAGLSDQEDQSSLLLESPSKNYEGATGDKKTD